MYRLTADRAVIVLFFYQHLEDIIDILLIIIFALETGKLRVRFPIVSLEFFIDIILPASRWPWDRLSL